MAQANGAGEAAASAPRKMKILMLHGYTQSGSLFHSKTRSLEKLLIKSFPASKISPLHATYPGGVTLSYPTAPMRLLPADIPGFEAREDAEQSDVWGWWKRETGSGTYVGLSSGLNAIAAAIKDLGGIDGVIGFSQGAAAAGMVASLLQPGRKRAMEIYAKENPEAFGWPESWEGLPELHPNGVKFTVCYSGFWAPNELYQGFYEPRISARTLHFIGSLDSVVEESRSLALVDVCEGGKSVYHPGGHFVPVGKEMGGVLVGFIRDCCEVKKVEESVEDMDVPF